MKRTTSATKKCQNVKSDKVNYLERNKRAMAETTTRGTRRTRTAKRIRRNMKNVKNVEKR